MLEEKRKEMLLNSEKAKADLLRARFRPLLPLARSSFVGPF